MMFQWQPDMVRFMQDASEYGVYHQKLAALMAPHLTKETLICDAGCGLGYLSLALAPHVGQVTAVDANANALRVLEKNCKRNKIDNIGACCGDIFAMPPKRPYDSMAFCFFGQIDEILRIAKPQCRGSVFAIKKNYRTHRFSVRQHPGGDDSYENACRYLRERSIPFESRALEVELGQPFRSLADARLFYETYCVDADKGYITDAFIRKKLVETGREDFPFYLPHSRKIGFLKFETRDIP